MAQELGLVVDLLNERSQLPQRGIGPRVNMHLFGQIGVFFEMMRLWSAVVKHKDTQQKRRHERAVNRSLQRSETIVEASIAVRGLHSVFWRRKEK